MLLDVKSILYLGITGVVGYFTYYTFVLYQKKQKYAHIVGPKPKGILRFYLGNLMEIREHVLNKGIFTDCTKKWADIYDTLFKIQILNNFLIVVNDPDSIRQVVIEKDCPKFEYIYKLVGYPYNERCLGRGLVSELDKNRWKNRRAFLNHSFQRSFLTNFIQEFNSKSDMLMDRLREKADGKTLIVLFPEINRLTLEVIASIAFGINTDNLKNRFDLNGLISKLLEGVNETLQDPFLEYKIHKYGKINEYKKAIRDLREFCIDHIQKRIKDMENGEHVPNDTLTIIIKNCQEDHLDLEDVVDEFLTFFIAGQETTANTLAFSILELGQNPNALKKIKTEVDEVLGVKPLISHDDLNKLEYTSCVFKETLRKWPPAAGFSRTAEEDMEINGLFIPKGTWLMVSTYCMGRNSKYFPDPEKFEPERFLKGSKIAEQNKVSSYTYFPFSLGPRNCLGQNFAQIEGKIVLAKFIQNFDFKLDENQSFRPLELATLRPEDGCRVYLKSLNLN